MVREEVHDVLHDTGALREGRDHAADCVRCEQPDAKLTQVDREITVRGALDEAQCDRLLYIAEQCPVHKSLAGAFHVRTTLRTADPAGEPPPVPAPA